MTQHTILLVEDSNDILTGNKKRLEQEGYRVMAARTLREARELLGKSFPDLAVLDILLPDGSGIDFCRQLVSVSRIPILFLTSLNDSEQVVKGLRAGGDDYLTKPYNEEEFLARIEALLRRMEQYAAASARSDDPRLWLDTVSQTACWEGRDLHLNPKEYRLFLTLMNGRNRFLTAEELYSRVWSMNSSSVDIRTVEVHISRLRTKLNFGQEPPPMFIEHQRGRGYRLHFSSAKK